MHDSERKMRKDLQRRLQDAGMSRADARRTMYGPSWKDKAPTRRASLAAAVRANAEKRRLAAEQRAEGSPYDAS